MSWGEYNEDNRQDVEEEIYLHNTDKIFQDLVNEVQEEETRFLKSINFPVDRRGNDWYY